MGLGPKLLDLGLVVCWLCEYQDSLQSLSRWIDVPVWPEVECARFTAKLFCRVYVHDFKVLSWESEEKQYHI